MLAIKIPEMPELKFEDEKHIYRLDGVEIPSVSTVMGPLSQHEYGRIDPYTLNKAAARGTAVHNAIENWIKYGLNDTDPDYQGYMDGFLEWWELRKPVVVGSEVRVYHKLFGYAGTIDLVAYIDGSLNLIDYKTTSKLIERNCRVQLEAYSQALESQGVKTVEKRILHLGNNGKWKEPEYPAKDAEAWRVFSSLKVVYDYIHA